MSTYKINKADSIKLRDIITSHPFNSLERSIQYGVQYTLECGIKCNVHYSDKSPNTLSVTLQKEEADEEIAKLLEFHILTISIDTNS